MEVQLTTEKTLNWKVEKIGVIGPGIVGMPMAALLAHARICIGTDQPAKVMVIQRNSLNSGWKVGAINAGKSVIGGIEPGLDDIVRESVEAGLLGASHDYEDIRDADVVLVSVQTDKKGVEPDYGPLFGALTSLTEALQHKPAHKVPLIVFESTLAPSSMTTVIREHFAKYGLIEGEDVLLGNSPNRVMPGRLVERVTESDKIVAGLHPATPKMIQEIYQHIVTKGTLHPTNSLTAEVVKTLENAYRDVRIAFSTEIVRYCDTHDLNFYTVRNEVNQRLAQEDTASNDPNAVPSGGILIPMIGVGGHCLPKDGILLWWRKIESGADTSQSLIIKSREINDQSPAETIRLATRKFGSLKGKKIAILGTAYRFNSEDTRNSPSLVMARQLLEEGCEVILQDPYVKPDDQNLLAYSLDGHFTRDIEEAVQDADLIVFGTAHKLYMEEIGEIVKQASQLEGIVDACNLYSAADIEKLGIEYTGIGRGTQVPSPEFIDFVYESFRKVEMGLGNEVAQLAAFLNKRYADSAFNEVQFSEVQRLAASCSTGCEIADTGEVESVPAFHGFQTVLGMCAAGKAKRLQAS